MLKSTKNNGLILLLSLLLLSTAKGAPTLTDCKSKYTSCSFLLHKNICIFSNQQKYPGLTAKNNYENYLAVEFRKPPASPSGLQASTTNIKSLPSIPDALLMALGGFLCVSIIKDRKFWIAFLTSLLWLGQSGFTILPYLVSHFAHQKPIEQKQKPNTTCICKYGGTTHTRNDVKDTKYIGLLHQLASITKFKNTLTDIHSTITYKNNYYQNLHTKAFEYLQIKITHISQQLNANKQSRINPLPNCLVLKYSRDIFHSQAYSFPNITRGPPKQT